LKQLKKEISTKNEEKIICGLFDSMIAKIKSTKLPMQPKTETYNPKRGITLNLKISGLATKNINTMAKKIMMYSIGYFI